MHFGIVGAGAIGCLFAARLKQANYDVTLFHHRTSVVAGMRRHGLRLKNSSGDIEHVSVHVRSKISKRDEFDFVLVTVKAYDTEATTQQLTKSMRLNTPVLTLQNGLGNVEILSKYLPADSILAGSTTEASRILGPGLVEHTGGGVTQIGELDGNRSNRIVDLRSAFQTAGFDTRISKNIRGVLWSKALANAAINPLTAINRLHNGGLAQVPEFLQLANAIVQEAAGVAKALRIRLAVPGPALLETVLRTSRRNKSSMLQDLERGKKTEVRQINGIISDLGKRYHITTPYNSLLTATMIELETFAR